MKSLVLASGNRGKVREFNQLLSGLGYTITPQTELAVTEIEETGLSFVENAILKARNAAAQSGLAALADDSGLEVDALAGEPGIYSARYAGVGASDAENVAKLLQALEGVEPAQRQARFQAVIVYMRHATDPTPLICHGTWEGSITTAPIGENGFGYDPIFWVALHGCSAAQLTAEQKNALSHRGQALRELVGRLGRDGMLQNDPDR